MTLPAERRVLGHAARFRINLISLAVPAVVSPRLPDADWHKRVRRFPRPGQVFFDMARFSTGRFSLILISFTETVAVPALICNLAPGLAPGAPAAEGGVYSRHAARFPL
jgi:hypothetical protein